MGKIEQNKQKKKQNLLDSAFHLFTSKGLNDTSITEIVKNAGVAKGTFYLYFKDKYDIQNFLVSHKASQLLTLCSERMDEQTRNSELEDKIIFIANEVLDRFEQDKSLLTFISKNLSWGFFKNALLNGNRHSRSQDEVDFYAIYQEMLQASDYEYKDPELMIYMIVELISSTSYSVILYNEPVTLDVLKPYLFESIHNIVACHKIGQKDAGQ